MKKNKAIIIIIIFCLTAFGCSKNDIYTFSDTQASIYFAVKPGSGYVPYTDSTDFTFIDIVESEAILNIRVQAIGLPSEEDRAIDISIDTSSTAIKNVHYIFPENIVIKAGLSGVNVPIKLLKHSSLSSQEVMLSLNLKENQWFDLAPMYSDGATIEDTVNLIRHTISISSLYKKPSTWDQVREKMKIVQRDLGKFTQKKFSLIIEKTGFLPSDWEDQTVNEQVALVIHQILYDYLVEQDVHNTPIYEDELFDKNETQAKMWVQRVEWEEGEFKKN